MGERILILHEAGSIQKLEKYILRENSRLADISPDKSLLFAVRANPRPGSYVKRVAGASTLKRHQEFPLSYAILEVCFGDEPRRESSC